MATGLVRQRWKKVRTALTLSVQIFTAVLIFGFCTQFFLEVLHFLCNIGFAFLHEFEPFFAHILSGHFSRLKLCQCYFLSFFHLCCPVVVWISHSVIFHIE